MALTTKHKEVNFGVGDTIRVKLKIKEGEKTRNQNFEGIVIGIKGRDNGKTFTVRKVGAANVGVEMIFPINTPSIDSIEVVRAGTEGIKQAKLYYIRDKSPREIEKIYSRAKLKNVKPGAPKKQKVVAKKTVKKVASKKKSVAKKTK